MKAKKILTAILLCSCVALGLVGCSKQEDKQETSAKFSDGTYNGTGKGYHGDLELKVTFGDNKIQDLEVVSHNESSVIIDRAFPLLKERILEAQSTNIDTVSGATFTSFAVRSALAEAAKEAGVDFGTVSFVNETEEAPRRDLEEVKTQIVVVGGGPAGLSAAIEAKEAGINDVIVIEKMDILSGNGKFDMNFYDMLNSQAQRENGIEDSAEKYIADKKDKVWDSMERLEAQAHGAEELDPWLREMGCELNYNYSGRGHMAEADQYAGEVIQNALEKRVNELGIEVRTNTKGYDLIMEDGKAVGVKVQSDNDFYDIKADAVIMATGGFSNNKELLKEYAPGHEELTTSNQIGATGDFVKVFEKNNFAMDHMDEMRVFPIILQGTRHLAGPSTPGFILVNENGERFVDETLGGIEMAQAILAQEGKKVYYIYDDNLNNDSFRLQKHAKEGWHKTADSLDELAEEFGINAENLKASVQAFNDAAEGKSEDEFREKAYSKPMNMEGKFYGALVESGMHMTKGGVLANEKAEIIDNDGNVVPGIYAAGEVAASSASYSSSVIFGRISGQQAAEYVKSIQE